MAPLPLSVVASMCPDTIQARHPGCPQSSTCSCQPWGQITCHQPQALFPTGAGKLGHLIFIPHLSASVCQCHPHPPQQFILPVRCPYPLSIHQIQLHVPKHHVTKGRGPREGGTWPRFTASHCGSWEEARSTGS